MADYAHHTGIETKTVKVGRGTTIGSPNRTVLSLSPLPLYYIFLNHGVLSHSVYFCTRKQ